MATKKTAVRKAVVKKTAAKTRQPTVGQITPITVADLESAVSRIDDAVLVIRRGAETLLTPHITTPVYGRKKAVKAKTLKTIQRRLAQYGLSPTDYVVISHSTGV